MGKPNKRQQQQQKGDGGNGAKDKALKALGMKPKLKAVRESIKSSHLGIRSDWMDWIVHCCVGAQLSFHPPLTIEFTHNPGQQAAAQGAGEGPVTPAGPAAAADAAAAGGRGGRDRGEL
jgi:hypothetical protein